LAKSSPEIACPDRSFWAKLSAGVRIAFKGPLKTESFAIDFLYNSSATSIVCPVSTAQELQQLETQEIRQLLEILLAFYPSISS
jgi:hypothetical protein